MNYIPLEYVESKMPSYIDLNYSPTFNTKFVMDFTPLEITDGVYNVFAGTSYDGHQSMAVRLSSDHSTPQLLFGDAQNKTKFNLTVGVRRTLSMDKGYWNSGDELWGTWEPTSFEKGNSFGVGNGWNPEMPQKGDNRFTNAIFYSLKFYENGELVRNFIPAQVGTEVGFYETVTDYFVSGVKHISGYDDSEVNQFIAGPFLHAFAVSPNYLKFDINGGSKDVMITATTTWTVTSSPDWATLSINSGDSGDSTMTITCEAYNVEGKREGTIIMTDADDFTLTVKIRQTGIINGIPLHLGELEVPTMYLGETEVIAAYLGESEVFQA